MKKEDEIRKNKILEYIYSENYTKMTAKQLAVIFVVPKEEYSDYEKLLFRLEREAYFYFDDSKRICRIYGDKFLVCKFEAKSRGYGFARVISADGEYIRSVDIKDIYIPKENTNMAFDSDIVLVETSNFSDGKNKEGRVVRILQRSDSEIICTFQMGNGFGFALPLNVGIEDIYIPGKKMIGLNDGDAIAVRITKYPTISKKAEGRIVKVLGNMANSDVEVASILASYGIEEDFKDKVIEESRVVSTENILANLGDREDFRNKRIYTIDGDDAKDLDDAVVVNKNEDGTYTLSVHIADVSHYVKRGSELDKEAIKRGTSIYTPALVVPMLPRELSNGICSLNEGEPRLTLAVDVVINEKGEILDSKIYKSVIVSNKRMTYTKVQAVLDRSNMETVKEYTEYIYDIELMASLAKILKAKREREGSINFDIPETKVILDEKGDVVDVKPYEITFANNIIEEFMLVANKVVAETFLNLDSPFIYRIHETPDVEKLRELNEVLGVMGTSIKGINNVHPRALADAMRFIEENGDAQKTMIVSSLMLRSLKLAKYSDKCLGHFGLGFKYYCHFTSPIRRYPDLFIHRVISEYIESSYNVEENLLRRLSKEAVEYSLTSSDREKNSTEIEREFDNMYMARYMKKHMGEVFEGVISGVTKFGMYVKLQNTVEGMVTMTNLNDDYYIYEENSLKLVGQRTGKTYEIGEKITVQVIRADDKLKQIDFLVVGD